MHVFRNMNKVVHRLCIGAYSIDLIVYEKVFDF